MKNYISELLIVLIVILTPVYTIIIVNFTDDLKKSTKLSKQNINLITKLIYIITPTILMFILIKLMF